MPGYGVEPGDDGLLPWTWAEEHLIASRSYWVSTLFSDGRPQLLPVWGVWLDDAIWFSSSPAAHRVRNLAADPRCTVSTDDAHEPVVLEGRAERVDDEVALRAFAAASDSKYDVSYGVDFYLANTTFRVIPAKVIALDEAAFQTSPTRWRF